MGRTQDDVRSLLKKSSPLQWLTNLFGVNFQQPDDSVFLDSEDLSLLVGGFIVGPGHRLSALLSPLFRITLRVALQKESCDRQQ